MTLGAETIDLLRTHKRHQAEMKMANRAVYHDFGLVFAKEWADLQSRGSMLGHPLQMNNLGQREYAKLIKAANVRPIKFHGLRHTCATLLLQARQPVHVVSERLGHSKVAMTMEVTRTSCPTCSRMRRRRSRSYCTGDRVAARDDTLRYVPSLRLSLWPTCGTLRKIL